MLIYAFKYIKNIPNFQQIYAKMIYFKHLQKMG